MAISILHFSDFHLDGKDETGAENTVENIIDVLAESQIKVDLIIFTGDMINKGGEGYPDIETAFKRFMELVITPMCEALGVNQNRFIFVPGNHDIKRDDDDDAIEDYMETKTTSVDNVVAILKDPKTERRTGRINRVKKFEYDHYSSLLDSEHYRYSRYDSHFIIDVDGYKVGISSLNTVWRCGFDDDKKIVMGLSQIKEAVHFLKSCDIKIAATHYRYDKLKEFEGDDLKDLVANYYDIYLTGHTHSASISYLPNGKGKVALDVNTAGALVSNEFTKHEKYKNAFQVITYTPGVNYVVKEFKLEDGISFSLNRMKGENGVENYPVPNIEDAIGLAKVLEEKAIEKDKQKFEEMIRPFRTLVDSRKLIKSELFAIPFEECTKTLDLKKDLLNPDNKDIRLMALSGMGKTRIVFDVFDGVENVYYSSESDCSYALDILLEKIDSGIVVIDNCPIDNLYSFQEIVEKHNSSVKLVTIHNVLIPKEKKTDGKVLELNYDETEEIIDKLINRETVLEGKDEVKRMIRERSGNIPFMAILLIDAYKKNGNFEIDKKNKVLATLLKGKSGELSINSEKALRALSLFEPLGCQNNVLDEYQYVTNSIGLHRIFENQANVNGIFSDVITDYSRRQLIEIAGSCLRVRPKPLAEWLTEAWMDENESIFGEVYNEIINQEEGLSNRLSRALDNRFAEMTKSNCAKQIFDQYNNPVNGSFHDERIAFSKSGSRLFLSMGVVSPVMVAKNLESLIYSKSVEWLRDMLDKDVRRNLIWAMENIIMDAEAFESIAKSLGRLALAENESISNNATGQFLQLFHIILSGTRANLNARMKIIEFFEAEGDCDELLIKAVDHALNGRGFMRSNTSRYKSVNNEPEDYYPYREEVYKYWMCCLDVLERIGKKSIENRDTVNEVLTKHVTDFQEIGFLSVFLDKLDIFAKEVDYKWTEMRNALSMNLHYWFKGNEEERKLLFSWIEKLSPTRFYERMQTCVNDEHYKDRKNWRILNESMEKIMESFVDEFLQDKIYKTDELKSIIRDRQFNYFWFVKSLAVNITNADLIDLFDEIYNMLASENQNFESPFVVSLAGMLQNKVPVERLFGALHKDGYYRLAASLEGILDNEKNCYLNRVIEDVKCGRYDNSCINNYLRYGRGENILIAFDNYNKMRMEGIDLYEVVYPYLLNVVLFYDVKELEAKGCLNQYKKALLEYPFSQDYQGQAYDVIDKIGEILDYGYDSVFAMAAHEMAVKVIVENYYISSLFEHLYFKLLPKYQEVILDNLLDTIAANDIRLRFYLSMNLYIGSGFGNGKGPLFQCDEQKLKDACKRYPSELPERLARMCPVYEYEEQGPVGLSNFFLWLCDNYGDNEEMFQEFSANMGTLSWSGVGGFSNYIAYQRKFIEPLLSHPNITVRKWAERQCKSIDDDVKRERDREEYSRMVRG